MSQSKIREALYPSSNKNNYDSIYKKNMNLYDEKKSYKFSKN